MVDNDMLEALRSMMREELAQSEKRMIERMDEGFERIEYSINELSKDVGRIEKRLGQHIEQPIH